MPTWMQFAIVCPMVFLAGIVDAIAGGGGLITLPTYMLVGIPPHMALGTNKMGAVCGTTLSTARFAKNGYIPWKKVMYYIPAALVGSYAGASLTLLVSEQAVRTLMMVSIPLIGALVLGDKNLGKDMKAGTIPERKVFLIALSAAFFIGMYDGFYGPGTGTFLLLILTEAARMSLREAAGTTKAINCASNAAAVVTFLLNGKVWIALGLAAGAASMLGNYVGTGLVIHDGAKYVRPVVMVVLCLLFVKLLTGM